MIGSSFFRIKILIRAHPQEDVGVYCELHKIAEVQATEYQNVDKMAENVNIFYMAPSDSNP
jgi:hypothetical protein